MVGNRLKFGLAALALAAGAYASGFHQETAYRPGPIREELAVAQDAGNAPYTMAGLQPKNPKCTPEHIRMTSDHLDYVMNSCAVFDNDVQAGDIFANYFTNVEEHKVLEDRRGHILLDLGKKGEETINIYQQPLSETKGWLVPYNSLPKDKKNLIRFGEYWNLRGKKIMK